mgnify:CR=1 FL=1
MYYSNWYEYSTTDCWNYSCRKCFCLAGIGKLCIASIFNRDYPVIQAYVLMVGTLFVVFNLIFDIVQYISDPRLRKGME